MSGLAALAVRNVIRALACLRKRVREDVRLYVVGSNADDPDERATPETARLRGIARDEGVARARDVRRTPRATIVALIHRMSTLRQFDTVILMAHGRIVDYGTADALFARQPAIRELMQQGDALEGVASRRRPCPGTRRGRSRPTS